MKKTIFFFSWAFVLFSLFFISTDLKAVNSGVQKNQNAEKIAILKDMNTADFLNLSVQDFQKLAGKKLSLKDKITLKLAQRKVSKKVKKGQEVVVAKEYVDISDIDILAFLLGFVLGPLGVLLAWLFIKNGLRSSLIGLLFLIALVILWRILF